MTKKPQRHRRPKLKIPGREDRPTLINRLGQLKLFSGLSRKELSELLPLTEWKKLTEGTVVFEEGDSGNTVYVIERGKISIYHNQNNGRTRNIAILSDGDFFGEMSLLESKPRSAAARAVQDTLIISIEGRQLWDWVKKNPSLSVDIGIKILRVASERLRQTTQDLSAFHRLSESLWQAKTQEEVFESIARELNKIIEPDLADGWVIYAYNPYLEEFHPQQHAGDVPGDLLVNKKTLPLASAEFSVYDFGAGASLVLIKPNNRFLSKKTPLIEALAGLSGRALADKTKQRETGLRLRPKSPSVNA